MSTMGRPSSDSPDLFELTQNDNRRPEDWRAQAQTTPEVFVDDIALLDAAARACVMPAIERERTLGRDKSTSGGKGGKGGNLQSFGNSGLFDDGATRRKPGGNWRKPLVPVQGDLKPTSS